MQLLSPRHIPVLVLATHLKSQSLCRPSARMCGIVGRDSYGSERAEERAPRSRCGCRAARRADPNACCTAESQSILCRLGVIRDRAEPASGRAMSAMPPKAEVKIRVLASAMTDYGGLMMPPPRQCTGVLQQPIWQPGLNLGQVLMLAACRFPTTRWPPGEARLRVGACRPVAYHSMSSSALASSAIGMVRPSAFALRSFRSSLLPP